MFTVASGTLEPTATYQRRSWAWVSNGTGEAVNEHTGEVIPCLGVLTIKVQHRDRRECRGGWWGVPRSCEIDSYAVQEAEPQFPGCVAYLLLNLTDASHREPYLVHVRGYDTCRCKAGSCKVDNCKHRAALEALLAEGLLDPAPLEAVA